MGSNRKYPDVVWMRTQVPDEAHARLARMAIDRRMTIVALAREILIAASLPGSDTDATKEGASES